MNRRTLSLIVSLLGLIYLGLAAISLYQYFRVAQIFASYGISEAAQNDMPRIVEVRRTFLSGFTLFLLLGLPSLIVGVGLYFRREWARRAWLVLVLLDQVRTSARLRHFSLRTEKAYLRHIKRFILFHGKRHPRELSEAHIRDYVSDLAVNRSVSASTQNVALLIPRRSKVNFESN